LFLLGGDFILGELDALFLLGNDVLVWFEFADVYVTLDLPLMKKSGAFLTTYFVDEFLVIYMIYVILFFCIKYINSRTYILQNEYK
jgi:hypothetical protein